MSNDRQRIAELEEQVRDQKAKIAEACARNSSMAVDLAAMQQERNAALDRAWRAETSLSHSYSLRRDIASELGCADLTGEAQLDAGLAKIRELKRRILER
jgi:type II secretory pathway pseudopilin PulG